MRKIFCPKGSLIGSLKHLNTEGITYFQTEVQPPQGSPSHTHTLSSTKGRKRKNLPSHLPPCTALYRVRQITVVYIFLLRAKISKNSHFLKLDWSLPWAFPEFETAVLLKSTGKLLSAAQHQGFSSYPKSHQQLFTVLNWAILNTLYIHASYNSQTWTLYMQF